MLKVAFLKSSHIFIINNTEQLILYSYTVKINYNKCKLQQIINHYMSIGKGKTMIYQPEYKKIVRLIRNSSYLTSLLHISR